MANPGDYQNKKPDPGELAFLHRMVRDGFERDRKFRLGYTIEEERMWLIFNRCCHRGRKIKMLARPIYMATGKPSVRIMTPFISPDMARSIIEATQ